jgi:hypothetical protein
VRATGSVVRSSMRFVGVYASYVLGYDAARLLLKAQAHTPGHSCKRTHQATLAGPIGSQQQALLPTPPYRPSPPRPTDIVRSAAVRASLRPLAPALPAVRQVFSVQTGGERGRLRASIHASERQLRRTPAPLLESRRLHGAEGLS